MKSKGHILLIAPVFFDYYKEIIKELKKMGYFVRYICDAPNNSNITKAIGRINRNLIKNKTNRYFNRVVLPKISGEEFEYVVLVAGMTFSFSPEMIEMLRTNNPQSIFVMYQWDSEKNLPYAKNIHKYFDRVFSFDRGDCEDNDIYTFLPLFYIRDYERIGKVQQRSYEYDCLYVGTAHPQKYKSINEISANVREIMPKQYIYHYMPSVLKYLYHKITAPEYKGARYKEFGKDRISKDSLLDMIKKTRCVLDAPQAGQTGLTIRSIECLGAKRKLITSNESIKQYDFYKENNVLVYDGKVDTKSSFFTEPYEDVDEEIYKKYSLREWLRSILS